MIDDQQLATVLSEFAQTLSTDFPIQAVLDHLVEQIVGVLPITSAGVTLVSVETQPQYVAASDANALLYEQMQVDTGQGPCVTACQTGQFVSVPDMSLGDARFPEFCAEAWAAGLGAVFTFPLRHGATGARLGALDVYCASPTALDTSDLVAAHTFADVATAYLLNAQACVDLHDAADSLRDSTLHDPLTGLANRVLLHERLQHSAASAQRSHALAAVLIADLDGFKAVNDAHGHAIGDELLIAVAHRLSGLLRPGDTLARIAGDEFVILCENIRDPSDVFVLATRIDGAFVHPFVLASALPTRDVVAVSITASVGIAFSGPADEIGDELIRHADSTMYQAKRKGSGRHRVIDLRDPDITPDKVTLARDLHGAITGHQLELAYQPIVRLGDGTVTGVEALLRWTHPVFGPIPARTTVALAEESAMLDDITAWILTRACADQATWNLARPATPLNLAVNISPAQLLSDGFCDLVRGVMSDVGTRPGKLTLEVTELVFLTDGPQARRTLTELKALGVRVALDNFGTGRSSLNYLRQFPVDIVKIDRGFIAEIAETGHAGPSGAIIAAVADLGHALGMSVTAEGVETSRQRAAVIAVGCESAQGYYYAHELTSPELTRRLDASPVGGLRLPTRAGVAPVLV